MSEFRRRLMMQVASDPNALPVGCVRLEYIEGTGTQYIDTEKVVYANEDIYMDFQIVTYLTNIVPYGWRWKGFHQNHYQCYLNSYLNANISLMYGQSSAAPLMYPAANKYTRNTIFISPNKKVVALNGIVQTTNYDKSFQSAYDGSRGSVYPPAIMNINILGSIPNTTYAPMRLYEYSLTDSEGNYTQHLIPILDPNGIPCMYDTVAKKFHYNKGADTFLYKIAE